MNKLIKTLLTLGGIAALSVLITPSTKAQSVIPLVVAPARQVVTADPGKLASFAIRFYNTGLDPISGTFQVADFIVDNSSGSPTFLEGPTTLSNRFSAAKWVTLNTEKGTLSGSGMVTINGTIKVPSDAIPGGKYFAVFFEPTSNIPSATGTNNQEEAASVSVRIAGLVYLKVAGPIAESATVTKFSAPGFSEYGPITITTEIKNSGDYHITPKGQVIIKNIFGKEVAKEDLAETNVFPDASRTISTKLGQKWMVGKYTATLDATYGDSAKALSAVASFWVFPWKVMTIIILGIIIVILIVIIIINKFVKKEKKLEEELIEEKAELEKLKENLMDKFVPENKTNSDRENTPENKI